MKIIVKVFKINIFLCILYRKRLAEKYCKKKPKLGKTHIFLSQYVKFPQQSKNPQQKRFGAKKSKNS